MSRLVTVVFTLLAIGSASRSIASESLVPVIVGPWVRIAGNPDLGIYASDNQQPVDFAIWQAADGSWQAWSCIRNTKCGGNTRLLYRWEGEALDQPNWQPMGIAMEANPALGETAGGLQAPHVIREGRRFHLFYGDWQHICRAVSDDGKHFQRVIGPEGKTGMFSEGLYANTRDVMMLKVDQKWHAYYAAFPNHQCAVYVRTTTDFKDWSDSTVVAFGGIATTGPYSAECPHVVWRNGAFYLFRTQHYGMNAVTSVYRSSDPTMFGINQDDRYLVTRLAVAAPEIIHHDGRDYIAALTPELDGLQIAPLSWLPPARTGRPVWNFESAEVRESWSIVTGDLAGPFTQSKRTEFKPPQNHFIGTAEVADRLDDARTGRIRSPSFLVDHAAYFAMLSGGIGRSLYIALIDAETKREVNRLHSTTNSNVMQPRLVPTDQLLGRRVYVEIVDQETGSWGHINFGGLFEPRR